MDKGIKKMLYVSFYIYTHIHTHTHTHTRILFSPKKNGNSAICGNMDKSGGHLLIKIM